MNIEKTSNFWLSKLFKTLAILLVLFALLSSSLRLLLPYVGNYKTELEDYINGNYNTQVSIGDLSMSWRNLGPVLIVKNVQLLDTEQTKIYIGEFELQVDMWKTLTRQQFVSERLTLKGAQIYIDEGLWNDEQDPAPKLDGTQQQAKENFAFTQVANLFLNRISRFAILDSQINVGAEQDRSFKIVRIHWLNDGAIHKAQGMVILDDLSDTQVKVNISVEGDDSQDLNGGAYLHANQIDITPWLSQFLAVNNDNSSSNINFDAWARIRGSEIDRLQVELYENEVSWNISNPKQNSNQTIKLAPTQVMLAQNKNKQGFTLYSTPFRLSVNEYHAQPFKLFMKKRGAKLTGHISSLDMAIASKILPLFVEDIELKQTFSQLSLTGTLDDIYLYNQPDDFIVNATLNNISTNYSGGIPGIKNVFGNLNFHNDKLTLDASSQHGAIDLEKHFMLPIPYDALSMNTEFVFNDQGWTLAVNDVNITSPELNLSGSLKVDAPKEGESTMGLLMGIVKGDARFAEHYYPLTLMSENLFNYLETSLLDGDITQANILFNGPLSNFPFKDNSGIFVVDAEIKDGTFKFANSWAPITLFTANLNFTNEGMMITGRNGFLTDLNIKGVEVGIADLGQNQTLTVDAIVQPVEAHEFTKLLQQSPYKGSVGAALETLNVVGKVDGNFHLTLPLDDTSKGVAQGQFNFKENNILLQTPRVDFTDVNGSITFVNDKILTQNLTLNYAGLPLKLDVTGEDRENNYKTYIDFKGDWQNDTWLEKVPTRLKKYAQGEFQWQGDLALYNHKDGGFSYTLDIDSDLNNIKLNLPVPYAKVKNTDMPFSLKSRGGIRKSTIELKAGEQLNFFGELKHDTTSFSKSHLVLGDDSMLLPMNGFHITTKLEKADVGLWLPMVNDILHTINPPNTELAKQETKHLSDAETTLSKPLLSSPKRVRGSVEELTILGQTFHNSSFNLLDKPQWWLLQLNAKETRSRIKLHDDWENKGMSIDADFVHFADKEIEILDEYSHEVSTKHVQKNVTEEDKVNLRNSFDSIPRINFVCARCQINKLRLGEVSFDIVRENKDEIQLQNFIAKRSDASVQANAAWQLKKGISKTTLVGNLDIDSIEHELTALSFGSIIRDSGGKLNFNVNWSDAPNDFSLGHLNGKLDVAIDDGYLAQVPDTAKIFSVLSLESLLRKLTLDFRDIFSDGMFYSSIKGNYDLNNGVLHTDDTKMNGTAGDLILKGTTDLSLGMVDYKMSYKPNLTSSLPVIAWVATSLNPATFLAGIALDQIITANVVSEFNFELKGPIDDPQLKELGRKSKNVSVNNSDDITPDKTLEQPEQSKNGTKGNGA